MARPNAAESPAWEVSAAASESPGTASKGLASFPGDLTRPTIESLQRELAETLSEPEWQRVYRLKFLIPQLPTDLLSEVLDKMLQWDTYDRREGLALLVPHLSPELIARALEGVLQWKSYDRREGLALLVPHLSPELIARALEGVLQWEDYDRRKGLALLVPHLSPELIARALEGVLQWEGYDRPEGLALLVPHLSPELIARALEVVLQWESYYRREGLAVLWPYLSTELQGKALRTVLRWDGNDRKEALRVLAPLLGLDFLRMAMADVSGNLEELDLLLPFLPETERSTVVASTYRKGVQIGDQVALIAALTALTSRLLVKDEQEAVGLACAAAHKILDDVERGFACLILSCSSQLPVAASREFLSEALVCTRTSFGQEESILLECAISWSPVITDVQTREILESVRERSQKLPENHVEVAQLMMLFAPKLSAQQWEELFRMFSSSLERESNPNKEMAYSIAGMVPRLPVSTARLFRKKFLGIIRGKNKERTRADPDYADALALAALSPHCTNAEARELAAEVLSITNEVGLIGQALLIPYVAESALAESLIMLLKTSINNTRQELLALLSIVEGGLLDLLGILPALSHGQPGHRCLELVGGPDAVSEALTSILDVIRWWP